MYSPLTAHKLFPSQMEPGEDRKAGSNGLQQAPCLKENKGHATKCPKEWTNKYKHYVAQALLELE